MLGLYRETAKEFARQLLEKWGQDIDSIILYGSVASGRATDESDIDILIVTQNKAEVAKTAFDIAYELDWENDLKTLTMPFPMTLAEVRAYKAAGSPLIWDILRLGSILYDDGSFERVRQETLAAG